MLICEKCGGRTTVTRTSYSDEAEEIEYIYRCRICFKCRPEGTRTWTVEMPCSFTAGHLQALAKSMALMTRPMRRRGCQPAAKRTRVSVTLPQGA